jgi:hypothetical protein
VRINKKAWLFALLILGVASEALASDYDGNQGTVQLVSQKSAKRPSANAAACPSLEGYPDCHSGSASDSAWGSAWAYDRGSAKNSAKNSAKGSAKRSARDSASGSSSGSAGGVRDSQY